VHPVVAHATVRQAVAINPVKTTVTSVVGRGHVNAKGDHANRAPASERYTNTVSSTTTTRSTAAARSRVTTPA
jgi:hypothetical protein